MEESTFEQWCHDTRKEIDACIQNVKQAKQTPNVPGIRELSLAYTKLQEAKMWIGKVLEEAGSELPAQYADKS